MVYLRNTQDPQVLFVPKSIEGASNHLTLKVRNTTDLSELSFGVLDLPTSNLYYNLAVELPEEIVCGEYEYALQDDDHILSTGILVILDPAERTEYNKNIQYEQYKAE